MRLSQFIRESLETVLVEWEAFARATIPAAQTMSRLALRDHAAQILVAISRDMETAQTETERYAKSQGLAEPLNAIETSAATHGVMRQLVGFDLIQLAAEYRAVRATVLRLWHARNETWDRGAAEDMARFHEAVDQALAESVASYSERVSNSRDTFLAILGHDLRSPLSAVTTSLYVLGQPDLEAATRERTVQMARRSAAAMGHMITDLLEYTRTRLGRGIEVVPEPGDVAQLCRELVEEARAAHPRARFSAEIPETLRAEFDRSRLAQVLTNLLGNAVQHGDAAEPIRLHVAVQAERVVIVVLNRGPAIPTDALQVIFDPLVRVATTDDADDTSRASLGLGLYIAREIVVAHGGEIMVTSTAADGTAFEVNFPLRAAPAHPA